MILVKNLPWQPITLPMGMTENNSLFVYVRTRPLRMMRMIYTITSFPV